MTHDQLLAQADIEEAIADELARMLPPGHHDADAVRRLGDARARAAAALRRAAEGAFFVPKRMKLGPQSDDPLMKLAQTLRDTMERLDPTDSPPWEAVSAADKDFYRDVVLQLLDKEQLVLEALRAARSQ